MNGRKVFDMIISTTPNIEGKTIKEYKGVVFGEAVKMATGGFTSTLSDLFEKVIIDARANAINKMVDKANSLGGNALVGITVDIKTIGDSRYVIAHASGTVVVME